jgi:hypothetical protein
MISFNYYFQGTSSGELLGAQVREAEFNYADEQQLQTFEQEKRAEKLRTDRWDRKLFEMYSTDEQEGTYGNEMTAALRTMLGVIFGNYRAEDSEDGSNHSIASRNNYGDNSESDSSDVSTLQLLTNRTFIRGTAGFDSGPEGMRHFTKPMTRVGREIRATREVEKSAEKSVAKSRNQKLQKLLPKFKVLVIGTELPWIESELNLIPQISEIVVLEFRKITIDKRTLPKVKTYLPSEFRERFLYGENHSGTNSFKNYFDLVVSLSSIEHTGLGRYGDILNPFGDLIQMQKIHCKVDSDAEDTL